MPHTPHYTNMRTDIGAYISDKLFFVCDKKYILAELPCVC